MSQQPFDWNNQQWDEALRVFGNLVKEASGNWESRDPIPPIESHSEILSHYQSEVPASGQSLDSLLPKLEHLVDNSGYNNHPKFLAYITAAADPIGVMGDFLAAAINQNPGISQIAPAASAIEMQTLSWFKDMMGYDKNASGIYSSGGQFANILALSAARNHKIPNVRSEGLPAGQKYAFYVSNQAHYCHKQALEMLGFGSNSLRSVPVTPDYRINIEVLESLIEEDIANGVIPIAIIANAGSVGCGMVDPIVKMAELAKRYDIWLHADGAYGAPAVITRYASADLKAISQADSIAFDPHKWFYSPVGAGVTLLKRGRDLINTFSAQPSYVQKNPDSEIIDFIDYTPENSRPFRALKVWLGIQYHGLDAYREMMEHDIAIIHAAAELIKATPSLELIMEPELSVVCWRYNPRETLDKEQLSKLQLAIVEKLSQHEKTLISRAELLDGSIVMRACSVNFRTTQVMLNDIIQQSANWGAMLENSLTKV